jgi:hypothetical protein
MMPDNAMTSEQRLDRLERIVMMCIRADVRARREMNEKINILIDAQIKTEDKFSRSDERFAKFDERFAKFDERFAKFDERCANYDILFAKNDERIKELGERANQTLGILRDLMRDRQNGRSENPINP